jgi:hypothetical protein
MEAPSSYLIGLLHNFSFAPGYNWVKPLSPRALWSNPVLSLSDGHRASSSIASPRRELPDAATCHPFLLGTSARVLRPKPVNSPPMVLRPKPPNPLTSSILHMRPSPLDTCHRRPRPAGRQVLRAPARLACPPSWLGQHGHSHVHLRLSMSQMSATMAGLPASWSLGPSLTSVLHHSRSISTARLYLTFTLSSTTASKLHTCTTQAKRHVAHISFAMVELVTTQPSSWITLIITHHKTKHKGTF